MVLMSAGFMTRLLADALDEAGFDRQLGGGKRQRLLGDLRSVTPSISNRMRPGLTRQTQNSGVPLPEPMRTSSGFLDTGTSGKTRIQTRPERFMWRVSARRAASICRAVTRSGSSAFRPNWPKARSTALEATPLMRPLCALRNFVRIGCSMANASDYLFPFVSRSCFTPRPAAAGRRRPRPSSCPAPSGRAP